MSGQQTTQPYTYVNFINSQNNNTIYTSNYNTLSVVKEIIQYEYLSTSNLQSNYIQTIQEYKKRQ